MLERISILGVINKKSKTGIKLIVTNFSPIVATCSFSLLLSIRKRIRASTIFKVKIGNNNVTVETTKSYIPTSPVESTLVYNGTSKKTKIFDANAQPPIVGGVIGDYSEGSLTKKGIMTRRPALRSSISSGKRNNIDIRYQQKSQTSWNCSAESSVIAMGQRIRQGRTGSRSGIRSRP